MNDYQERTYPKIQKLNQELNHDALNLLKVAEYHAAEGFHMASTFKAALKCVQIRMTTKTLIESALQIKGHLYFFPIYCLPSTRKRNIAKFLEDGLSIISNYSERRSFFGKITVNLEKQNEIGKYIVFVSKTNKNNIFRSIPCKFLSSILIGC